MKALIIIDVQLAVFNLPNPLYRAEYFLENAEKVIKAAREFQVPIIYLQHNRPHTVFDKSSPTWHFHPRLAPEPHDIVIQKTEPDGFMRTNLDSCLHKLGAEEVYICGLVTENCIESTVRGAYTREYKVHLFEDAHTTTGNAYLDPSMVIKYHNWLIQRFAQLIKTEAAAKHFISKQGTREPSPSL